MFVTATMDAPADSTRCTTVLSMLGTKSSRIEEPAVIGTPAIAMQSLVAILIPESAPDASSAVTPHQRTTALYGSLQRFDEVLSR